MGQSFAFAPGFTGMRCSSSDYGAGAATPVDFSFSRPLSEYTSSYLTRRFPVTSPLCTLFDPTKAENMGGLRHGN